MLPVRHLLHDQVPVRAAASVERRLSASDAARQGGQVQQARRNVRCATACCRRPIALGKLATIPVVVQIVNAANTNPAARKAMEKVLGVHRDARAARVRARDASARSAQPDASFAGAATARRTPGKVAIFATCYVNYNEPGIGHDLLQVLAHNEIPVRARREGSVLRHAEARARRSRSRSRGSRRSTSRALAKLAREGYAILTAIPSCTLMFKQELPLMFPGRRGREGGAGEAMFDPFEYLVLRNKDGLLKTDFKHAARQGVVSHPLPFARAEHRPEDPRGAGAGSRTRRSTRSSAARGTTARGASRASSSRSR